MVVLIGQYIDKMKRGEKTASEQSWCGYCVKKTPLLETQHIHSRYGGDLPQTKIQYHQTSQALNQSFTEVLKDSHITKAHPRRGPRGAAQPSKPAGSSVSVLSSAYLV